MKRNIWLVLLLLTCYCMSQAQGFYVKLHTGYNFPGFQNNATVMVPRVEASSTTSDGLVAMADINDSTNTYRQKFHSYASGTNISLGVGYMITHWFGVELGTNYLWNNNTSSQIYSDMTSIGFAGSYLDARVKTYSQHGLTLTPLLVFIAAKKEWKVQPQAKLGLVLPVYGKVIHEVDINSPLSLPIAPFYVGNQTSVKMNTVSNFSIGLTGSVGVRYTPIPFITIFVDVNAQWLNIKAKKTTITKWEAHDNASGVTYDLINGDPNDPSSPKRPVYRTEFEYVDQLDANSNNADYNPNYDPNKPKQDARITAPASNIGIQIGFQFNLSKMALAGLKKKKTAAL